MDILFNGTGFSCEEAAKLTESEFIKNHMAAGFKSELDATTRFALLKKAYELCLQKLGKEPEPEPEDEH